MTLELIPSLRIVITDAGAQQGVLTFGTINPGTWFRVQGVVRRDQRSLDISVTDFDDPLGFFERKDVKLKNVLKITNIWLNSAMKGETCYDEIYFGPVRKSKGCQAEKQGH